jgi:hypothetical protein
LISFFFPKLVAVYVFFTRHTGSDRIGTKKMEPPRSPKGRDCLPPGEATRDRKGAWPLLPLARPQRPSGLERRHLESRLERSLEGTDRGSPPGRPISFADFCVVKKQTKKLSHEARGVQIRSDRQSFASIGCSPTRAWAQRESGVELLDSSLGFVRLAPWRRSSGVQRPVSAQQALANFS